MKRLCPLQSPDLKLIQNTERGQLKVERSPPTMPNFNRTRVKHLLNRGNDGVFIGCISRRVPETWSIRTRSDVLFMMPKQFLQASVSVAASPSGMFPLPGVDGLVLFFTFSLWLVTTPQYFLPLCVPHVRSSLGEVRLNKAFSVSNIRAVYFLPGLSVCLMHFRVVLSSGFPVVLPGLQCRILETSRKKTRTRPTGTYQRRLPWTEQWWGDTSPCHSGSPEKKAPPPLRPWWCNSVKRTSNIGGGNIQLPGRNTYCTLQRCFHPFWLKCVRTRNSFPSSVLILNMRGSYWESSCLKWLILQLSPDRNVTGDSEASELGLLKGQLHCKSHASTLNMLIISEMGASTHY